MGAREQCEFDSRRGHVSNQDFDQHQGMTFPEIAGGFHNPVTGQRGTDLLAIDPHVASTQLRWSRRCTAWVSTVHLRVDHNFLPGGRPILWETMVFGPHLNPFALGVDEFQTRYDDQAEAVWGHGEVVKALTTLLVREGYTVVRHELPCPLLALQADYRRAVEGPR